MDNSVLIIGRRELASLMDLDAYLASADAAFRAHAEGRATARTLRAAGMNVDLAPVVDVVRP